MKRFEKAQPNDKVYCRLHGFGKVEELNKREGFEYPLEVKFDLFGNKESYTLDGYYALDDVEPTLFYVDGDNNYATERPTPRYYAGNLKVYNNGTTTFTNDLCAGGPTTFDFGSVGDIKLVEDVMIDGITFPEGTKYEKN
jgi:hypothetical protein